MLSCLKCEVPSGQSYLGATAVETLAVVVAWLSLIIVFQLVRNSKKCFSTVPLVGSFYKIAIITSKITALVSPGWITYPQSVDKRFCLLTVS